METEGISAIAQYGTAGISVLQIFVIVWMMNTHNKNIENRDAKIEGLSESILNANKENNVILEKYNKIIGNHIDHNTEQMKLAIEQSRETNMIMGELRDAINQLVGMNKNK